MHKEYSYNGHNGQSMHRYSNNKTKDQSFGVTSSSSWETWVFSLQLSKSVLRSGASVEVGQVFGNQRLSVQLYCLLSLSFLLACLFLNQLSSSWILSQHQSHFKDVGYDWQDDSVMQYHNKKN